MSGVNPFSPQHLLPVQNIVGFIIEKVLSRDFVRYGNTPPNGLTGLRLDQTLPSYIWFLEKRAYCPSSVVV
jgi:hypothetical protein